MPNTPCYRCGRSIPDGEPRTVSNRGSLEQLVEVAARPEGAPAHHTTCWECTPDRGLWREALKRVDRNRTGLLVGQVYGQTVNHAVGPQQQLRPPGLTPLPRAVCGAGPITNGPGIPGSAPPEAFNIDHPNSCDRCAQAINPSP